MKQRRLPLILLILPVSIFLSSWGWVGHQKISVSIINSFTEEMAMFNDWVPFLKDHSTDADDRKGSDPTEGPKHYIDIDGYPEFLSTGEIHTSLDTCLARHGSSFVDDMGYLPWATINTYNDIVEAMQAGEWEKAKIAAADLGHYVADGFMPLHITENYNGQLSGNTGIHSRYESYMIGDYQDQIIYEGSAVEDIEDITGYIFGYLYQNYQWVDDLLAADNTAKAVDASYGSLYKETLWDETADFTIELFKGASQAFANLLYNAWREAGKPGLDNASLYISEETAYLPEDIGITYGNVGVIYVVPENTNKDLALIRSASLDSLNALANIEVRVPLGGLPGGNYWIYARDYSGQLSGPINFSVIASAVQTLLTGGVTIYPNPFVHSSHIDLTLFQDDHVSIKIMDMNGRLTDVLHTGELGPGKYHFEWTGEGFYAGMYFVHIEIGEDHLIRQIVRK